MNVLGGDLAVIAVYLMFKSLPTFRLQERQSINLQTLMKPRNGLGFEAAE